MTDTQTIPYQGVLRLGSRGTQPVAVKRGLWHAGFRASWTALDSYAISAQILGPAGVRNLRRFQDKTGLTVDGVYGPNTHKHLQQHFDKYAEFLYLKEPPGPDPLMLPAMFVPTHQTAGLPGFPARDFFAKPSTPVGCPVGGVVSKLSGHDPAEGGIPGGAYGWSIYVTAPHTVYFLTHFGKRYVEEGDKVVKGQIIGAVCNARVAHMASNLSHIHEGKKSL